MPVSLLARDTSMPQVHEITELEALERWSLAWQALVARMASASYFHAFSAWRELARSRPGQWRVAIVEHAGDVLGIVPLRRLSEGRWTNTLADELAGGVVIGKQPMATLAAVGRAWDARTERGVTFELAGIDVGSAEYRALTTIVSQMGWRQEQQTQAEAQFTPRALRTSLERPDSKFTGDSALWTWRESADDATCAAASALMQYDPAQAEILAWLEQARIDDAGSVVLLARDDRPWAALAVWRYVGRIDVRGPWFVGQNEEPGTLVMRQWLSSLSPRDQESVICFGSGSWPRWESLGAQMRVTTTMSLSRAPAWRRMLTIFSGAPTSADYSSHS